MAEAARGARGRSGLLAALSAWRHSAAQAWIVDLLTVLIAVLLPWSTTGVVIAAVLWLVAVVPTLEAGSFLRSLERPICVLPVAMFALAVVGTLWSDAPWGERIHAVGPTLRLLGLPLLFYHFERSARGAWVFIAFVASCALLTAGSWLVAFDPGLSLKPYFSRGPYTPANGIVVKNYIDQSQEFVLCMVALAYPVLTLVRTNRIWLATLLAAVALSFLVNMMFVVISRTALVTMPIMLAVFALLHLRVRTAIAILCAALLLAALVWNVSTQLRATVSKFFTDYQHTSIQGNESGIGSRLIYWQKSLQFFAEAPLIGHGTGSTRGLFQQAAIGEVGARAQIVPDPHNQTLNVAVQWGALGVAVLYALWSVHLLLFRGDGLAHWVGLLVVVQNVFTSLFNSHLFDFNEGWIYVLGVGVAGGMVLGTKRDQAPRPDAARSDGGP